MVKRTTWSAAVCVQESDLANGAVTSSKIAGGAVTNGKIADNAVGSVKIATGAVTAPKLAPNSVNQTKITTGAISAAKLAPGAVNVTKLANSAVSTAKLQAGSVTSTRLADGAVTAAKLGLTRMIFIEAAGPAESDNCDALRAALMGITNNSISNRYVIFLGPGQYDCGASGVRLKPFVELRGSGRRSTLIYGAAGSADPALSALVRLTSNSALRDLEVDNESESDFVSGISAGMAIGPEITNVKVTARTMAGGSLFGIRLDTVDDASLRDVTAEADGGVVLSRGITLINSGASAVNLHAIGDEFGGDSTGLTCRNCILRGNDAAHTNEGTFISTQLFNGAPGTGSCVGSYDQNLDPLNGDCL